MELLTSIRNIVRENALVLADFPKAVCPLDRLQNNTRKQIGRNIDDKSTYCPWVADKRIYRTTEDPGHEASNAIITMTSLYIQAAQYVGRNRNCDGFSRMLRDGG